MTTKIRDIINKLEEIDKECNAANYSLDHVSDLLKLSEELKNEARLINQCCN